MAFVYGCGRAVAAPSYGPDAQRAARGLASERVRPSATLPRACRLLERSGYEAALASRPVAVRRHFSVFVQANALKRSRIGVIVSKKVAPRAVDRNRIKRLVRETFRHDRWRLGNNDLVVLARRCPPLAGWEAARGELVAVFVQLAHREHPEGV